MTILGKSKMSLRIEKQNVAGSGAPDGLSKTQCEYTALVVFSNACEAKFSQYSTTDWFSNNCRGEEWEWGGERAREGKGAWVASVCTRAVKRMKSRKGAGRYLVNELAFPDEFFHRPLGQHAKFGCNETDFARASPYHGRRTAVGNQFFEFLTDDVTSRALNRKEGTDKQGALEAPFDKHFVFVCHGHLKGDQRWAENGKRSDDAENIIFFKSVTQDIPTRGR